MNVHGKWFSSSLGSSLSFIWAACHISIRIIVVPGVSLILIKGNGMHVVVDHQLRYYIL